MQQRHPQEAIPHKKNPQQLKDMSYSFLMVINNKQGNGKKVGWVFKLTLRENMREAANDKHMV